MSADNGIYILQLADQSRVIHAQAVDNLFWDIVTGDRKTEPSWFQVYRYYKDADILTEQAARIAAFDMEQDIQNSDFPVLEYGISTIIKSATMTWDDVVQKAKEEAKHIVNQKYSERAKEIWASDIALAESLLNNKQNENH